MGDRQALGQRPRSNEFDPTGRVSAMNLSRLFIFRPVATTLLTLAVVLAGAIAFRLLPVSPLPQVDYPTISISANLPGASCPPASPTTPPTAR